MRIHILGICGTFMGGIAHLARALGHQVTGSDIAAYPPMSEQLQALGIRVMDGYDPAHLDPAPDCVVIGNALSRGNPAVEFVLDNGLAYTSGPAWLAAYVLQQRSVLAIAGTHGKTTTAAMLAWILDAFGLEPGFLVGGVPENFGISARLGASPFFVVEADEYDTAFFDKRAKFVHYPARTVVLNNLEYDHADIFPNLSAIQQQFHHLVRIVPSTGLILYASGDANLKEVLKKGCWTPVESFGEANADWQSQLLSADGSCFDVYYQKAPVGRVGWSLIGNHNVRNGLAAIAAAHRAGIPPAQACQALGQFRNVKRRLEVRGSVNGITVYDDFAHHPTAIAATLAGLRAHVGAQRILAILEPRSNTMRLGVHQDTLEAAFADANGVWIYQAPDVHWDMNTAIVGLGQRGHVVSSIDAIVQAIVQTARPQDHVLIMSNGAFGGIHQQLLEALAKRYA
jgi:UDP-N-acetylmuramate: L-alanyl-gamma-D-glutamyl-meso-diaminopimelate ligase